MRTESGYSYEVADSDATDHQLTTLGGIKLYVVGAEAVLSAFGFTGAGTSADTAYAQAALNWLAAERGRTLVWDVIDAEIVGTLTLPDASEWCVHFPLPTRITQQTDNVPVFMLSYSTFKYGFGFSGEKVRFFWTNSQSASDTEAIGVAFNPTTDISDGCFDFFFHGLQNENGYDLIGLHPAASAQTSPFWGYRIGELHHQTNAVGRVFNLNSGVSAGAPAGIIDKIYIKGLNAATAPFEVTAQTGVRVNSMEVNDAHGRAGIVTSSQNFSIGTLRFENCELANGEDLFVFTGSDTQATIEHLELQAVNTNAGAHVYGIKVDVSARLAVTGSVNVNGCTATGSGDFHAFKPIDFGKVVLPPLLDVQTDDTDVRLYEYAEANDITFASAVALGPWVLGSVANAASYTGMQSMFDGTNTYTEIVAPCDGWLVGLHVWCSSAVTAGSLAFRASINGTTIGGGGFVATLTNGQSASAFAIAGYSPGSINQSHRVTRGDRIKVLVTPTSVTGGGNATAQVLIAAAP
ncbi:hypothetical protein [Tropicimonas marinistellae]|uniref:hypothetical protein n=1 Tax=Tropicimonas marinistellae TaxID=1739787 RepID=UPI00082BF1A1|nr:hypothetical protein [Tropicimonas marinistellae]